MQDPEHLPSGEMKRQVDLLAGQRIQLRSRLGLQVCYQSGQSPPLVFLHGGLGNRFNWRSQYEFFANQGRSVLA